MSIDTDYAVLRSVLTGRPVDGVISEGPAPDPHGGWAAEFGVYSGYSLNIIAEHMPVIGFDSFQGLPEDWREGFPKGTFDLTDAPGIRAGFPPANAMIVPGWFDDTLPRFPFPPLSLIHVDCDLYSSTVTVLECTLRYMQRGTVIVFDEYHGYDGWAQHEALAWEQFCTRYRIGSHVIATGEQEKAFVITHLPRIYS